jgi:hypothetical protein
VRSVARVIVAEGFTQRTCPGEAECPTFQTAQDPDRVCKQCPRNQSKEKLSEIEGGFAAIPWLNHVFWLFAAKNSGVVFGLHDLTKDELDGIMMIQSIQYEIERERLEKDRIKQLADRANAEARRK